MLWHGVSEIGGAIRILSEEGTTAEVKASVRRLLSEEFDVRHVTRETERSDELCQGEGGMPT